MRSGGDLPGRLTSYFLLRFSGRKGKGAGVNCQFTTGYFRLLFGLLPDWGKRVNGGPSGVAFFPDNQPDRGNHEAAGLQAEVYFLLVGLHIYRKIFGQCAEGIVQFLHKVTSLAQFGCDPLYIAVAEKNGGIMVLCFVVGRKVVFGGMDGPSAGFEGMELVVQEGESLFDGAEVLEGATAPVEVEVADIGRNMVHIGGKVFHPFIKSVAVANAIIEKGIGAVAKLVVIIPTHFLSLFGINVGGEYITPEAGQHGGNGFGAYGKANAPFAGFDAVSFFQGLQYPAVFPLFAVKGWLLLHDATPVMIPGLRKIFGLAKLGAAFSKVGHQAGIPFYCGVIFSHGIHL